MDQKAKVAVIKGGGDLGTAVAIRLAQTGWRVIVTELPEPLVVRREVALATAVYTGNISIEGSYTGRKVQDEGEAQSALNAGEIPVLVDPGMQIAVSFLPVVLVDAIMAKRNTGTSIQDAPLVIALGPGFDAGKDCHAVIETQRGAYLGRPIYAGQASPDTGIPGNIAGESSRRLLRARADGVFTSRAAIGDLVQAGQTVAEVDQSPVKAEITGVVRGMLADGLYVSQGLKVGDIDPRGDRQLCYSVSDKAWAVADGVVEAILILNGSIFK